MTRVVVLALTLLAAVAPAALADGLPVLGTNAGPAGVAASSGDARYLALPAGRGTVVARVEPGGGRIPVSRFLPDSVVIPVVAYDGSASGLSADGQTLVLVRPRVSFPQRDMALTVLNARWLRVTRRLTLDGDFSFDALSPDGRWLYLIQYVSPRDMTRYLVRAYDLRRGQLLRAPIVDPNERPDEMRGLPLTRATSRDGRWAYTLYDGNGGHPFVHALDTVRRAAVCIDLDALEGVTDLSSYTLRASADGQRLTVSSKKGPALVIDTTTLRVGTAGARDTAASSGGGSRWSLVGAALVLVLVPLVGVAALLRRRRAQR